MRNFTALRLRQLFVVCALLLCFHANAKKVEVADAASVGHFFISQTLEVNQGDVDLNMVYTAVDATNPAEALYYVFNINQHQGFVIVSANDIAVPILGYSLQGAYQANSMPPNFEGWMNSVADAIAQGIQKGVEPDQQASDEWKALLEHDINYFTTRDGSRAVNPLITTKWDQGNPYNQQCPTYNGQKCYTGCVATAMAQVMKYHAYPASATGTTPAYTTSTLKIPVPAVELGDNYQWSDMTNTYNNGSPQPQKDAVALLMYHCGASVKMDYTPDGSGAFSSDAGEALTTYFKYDKAMRMQDRAYFSNDQWITLLKQELDAGRPMYHNGSEPAGGHAFVCDGYDNSNKFHFNWGWSGANDGYFSVTPLYSFPNNNNVFVGTKPNAGGTQAYNIDLNYNKDMETDKSSVAPMETFTISAPLYNSGYKGANGLQGAVALYQGNNLIATMGTKSIGNLQAGYYISSMFFTCQIPEGTPKGNYTIRVITKTSDSDWEVARATVGYKAELPITVKDKTYTITAKAEINGAINPAGPIEVIEGGSQTFTITANPGYFLSRVFIDNTNNPTAVENASYTFTDVTADHTITARFEPITYIIIATAEGNGVIDPAGEVKVNAGSDQTFTITADENYEILNVSVNGESVGAPSSYTFSKVTSDQTIHVTFSGGTGIAPTSPPEGEDVRIYPNPTSGLLTICDMRCATSDNPTSDIGQSEIEIFDVLGRPVGATLAIAPDGTHQSQIAHRTSQITFDLSNVSAGIYFLRITTENGVIVRKVVKE